MKNKVNQLFKDKLLLVMMVLGLLTMVAAAGAMRIRRADERNGENPYLEVPQTQGILAEEVPQNRTEEMPMEETKARAAGSAEAEYSPADKNSSVFEENAARTAGSGRAEPSIVLDYNGTERLVWPVRGNVILDYSMETTTYFPTLDQYKCNPALIIQGEVSAPVTAPADALVSGIGTNEEIGTYVVLKLGDEYSAICGQLKELQVEENQYIEKGTVLGYVAEPTKYYSIEGDNLYFELQHKGKPVDALNYLE